MPTGKPAAWRRELLVARSLATPVYDKQSCYRWLATWSDDGVCAPAYPSVRGSSERMTACVQRGISNVYMTYFSFPNRRRAASIYPLIPETSHLEPIRTSQEGQRLAAHILYLCEREPGQLRMRMSPHPAELQSWGLTWLDTTLNTYEDNEALPSIFALLDAGTEAERLRDYIEEKTIRPVRAAGPATEQGPACPPPPPIDLQPVLSARAAPPSGGTGGALLRENPPKKKQKTPLKLAQVEVCEPPKNVETHGKSSQRVELPLPASVPTRPRSAVEVSS